MDPPGIVVAGTGFSAVSEYATEALPGLRLDMIDPETLRREGFSAEILIPAMTVIDAGMMDRIRGLQLIQQWGAGLEGVDIEAATHRGIAVANVPTAGTGNAESVAEWCVMAAIAVSRRLPELQEGIRAGTVWGSPIGRALLGRTAGIVGLGGIGGALAVRLRAFGMRLVGLKRSPDPDLAEGLGMEWVGGLDELPTLLEGSDYVFLCLPLNEQTRDLIDESAFSHLPEGACIVNPGRGALLEQRALLKALSEGRLMGAGLDVFEEEPLDPGSPLLGRSDVLATPHIAGVTDAAYRGIAGQVADNARRLRAGQPLQNCLNWDGVGDRIQGR